MVKINVESFSEDELVKRWNELARKEDWDEKCDMCRMPSMLHKGPCTRKEELKKEEFEELWNIWGLFKERMKPIRKWPIDQEEKAKMQSDILMGMKEIVD